MDGLSRRKQGHFLRVSAQTLKPFKVSETSQYLPVLAQAWGSEPCPNKWQCIQRALYMSTTSGPVIVLTGIFT